MIVQAIIYIFRCPKGRVYAGKHECDPTGWPRKGSGRLPDTYEGSGDAWTPIFRKHGPACEWRILWAGPVERMWEVERRAIRLARHVFGVRCKNIFDGGQGLTSAAFHRLWADPNFRAKHAAGRVRMAANPDWQAAMSRRADDPAWRAKNTFAIARRSENLEWRANVAAAHARRLGYETCDPRADLASVRAEVGEQFTTADWERIIGKTRRRLSSFVRRGLIERTAPGHYRFTSAAATYSDRAAASAIAAE